MIVNKQDWQIDIDENDCEVAICPVCGSDNVVRDMPARRYSYVSTLRCEDCGEKESNE